MSPAVIPRGMLSAQAAWSRHSTDKRRTRIRAWSIIPEPMPAQRRVLYAKSSQFGGECLANDCDRPGVREAAGGHLEWSSYAASGSRSRSWYRICASISHERAMFSKILLSFGDAIRIANLRQSSACFLYCPTRRIAPLQQASRALSVSDRTLP
jgi:hypothetical protein